MSIFVSSEKRAQIRLLSGFSAFGFSKEEVSAN